MLINLKYIFINLFVSGCLIIYFVRFIVLKFASLCSTNLFFHQYRMLQIVYSIEYE